jgi:hypothetical protein
MPYSTDDHEQALLVVQRSNHFERIVASTLTVICHQQIYFLWGYFEDNAYRNDQSILDELKTTISNIIFCISPMKLQAM